MKRVFIPGTTSLEEIIRIAGLFERVDDGIGAASLAALGFAKLPQRAKFTHHNVMQKVDGHWNGMCAYVYESLSGEHHPGSKAIGAGFREKEYGRHVAELLKRWADAGRLFVRDELATGRWRRATLHYQLAREKNPFVVRGYDIGGGHPLGDYQTLNLATKRFDEALTETREAI